jgi:hypothetical protein
MDKTVIGMDGTCVPFVAAECYLCSTSSISIRRLFLGDLRCPPSSSDDPPIAACAVDGPAVGAAEDTVAIGAGDAGSGGSRGVGVVVSYGGSLPDNLGVV